MAPTTSPCDTCDARCCSAYAVHVTGDDAWRIAEGLGLPLHGFLAYAPQALRTGTGFLLEPGGPSYDLLLAHATTSDVRPPCVFLRAGDGGPPRCGVYALRPRACRRFPAARLEGSYGVRDDIVCPPGAWEDHDMGRLSWRVALGREDREAESYAAVVGVWNERVESAARHAAPTVLDYLDYLAEAYRWLVPWRATLRPAERIGARYVERVRDTLRSCQHADRPIA